METTDLITSFFNNEMSPEQERQFLVTVAASDTMRLGMKSHVMIDHILLKQADDVVIPETLRQSIMMQAGVTAATAAEPPQPPAPSPARTTGRRWVRILGSILMFCSGGALGYMLHNNSDTTIPNQTQQVPQIQSVTPAVQPPTQTTGTPAVENSGGATNQGTNTDVNLPSTNDTEGPSNQSPVVSRRPAAQTHSADITARRSNRVHPPTNNTEQQQQSGVEVSGSINSGKKPAPTQGNDPSNPK